MNYHIPAGIPYLQRVDEIMVWKVSMRHHFRLKDRSGLCAMVETLLLLHIPKLCPWCEGWLLMGGFQVQNSTRDIIQSYQWNLPESNLFVVHNQCHLLHLYLLNNVRVSQKHLIFFLQFYVEYCS